MREKASYQLSCKTDWGFGKKKVVDDLSLCVELGEIYDFLDPNGSGKTRSIRLMCGLLIPDSGSGTCLGYDILREQAEIKRHVGYMTQRFSFWEDLSIRENLEFIARLFDMPNRKEAVEQSLEQLGLQDRATQLAGTLSGGWKQRLALAACTIHKPRLLLLDEPTAGVDPRARHDFWAELHDLAAQGISVLVSTHYMDEAEPCHKLAYIAYGKMFAKGTAAEIASQQHLVTFAIRGYGLTALSQKLNSLSGIDQTVLFGNTLHVSGQDAELLAQQIKKNIDTQELEEIQTGLEDTFVYMMTQALEQQKQNDTLPLKREMIPFGN